MHCANNMKQLGIALHGYHAAMECFPPAGIGYGWCQQPGGETNILNASGLMMLLPYLEQQGLYNAYDQKQCACTVMAGTTSDTSSVGSLAGDPVTSGNAQVISTRLAVLSCPSDNGDPYIPADVPYYSIKPGSGYTGPRPLRFQHQSLVVL